jgi:glycosyltransferase involved in cell wall biosynthesis
MIKTEPQSIGPVDVCIVTKKTWHEIQERAEKNLVGIPYHHVIVERSRPLGLARQKAIARVDTPWFIFLDDDIELGGSWWRDLVAAMQPGVGALTGALGVRGMGATWDAETNKWLRTQKIGPTEVSRRASTHNALIRTDLVRDWAPSDPRLETYEDYELTQHVRGKGYSWLEIPTDAYHLKTWVGMAKNALWESRTKNYSNIARSRFGELVNSTIWMCFVLINPKYPVCVKAVIWWRHAFLILGALTRRQ